MSHDACVAALSHIVYGVEHHQLVVIEFRLLLKDAACLAYKVTQSGTLTTGDGMHGEPHILDIISIALEYRFIE